MEAVKRNANSKEIVAITVQENATGMMINTKNNASNRVLRAVYIFPDNDDHMIC
jgi:hypothetical protein